MQDIETTIKNNFYFFVSNSKILFEFYSVVKKLHLTHIQYALCLAKDEMKIIKVNNYRARTLHL